jgi:glycosyltransferase involved in cell wall biosynthesis
MTPRVSVLIPAHNAAATVAECLESLVAQSFVDFEVVLVDDGSTDGTAEAARRAMSGDGRLRLLSPGRVGLVGALNTGLEACRAPLVARLDADDLCRPERLALQVGHADTHPDVAIVGGGVASFSDHGPLGEGYQIYDAWLNRLGDHADIVREIFVESPLAHPAVLYRRDAVRALNGYRDPPWPEDYDLWLRAWQAGLRFGKVNEIVVDWRDHPVRTTRTDVRYGPDAFLACKAHYLARGPLAGARGVVIWGAGKIGRRLARLIGAEGIETVAFVDIDPKKIEGAKKARPPVIPQSELDAWRGHVLLGAVGSRGARKDIRRAAAAAGWREGEDFFCVA